jgi:putative nucleotidyltransferase with HDIG domain
MPAIDAAAQDEGASMPADTAPQALINHGSRPHAAASERPKAPRALGGERHLPHGAGRRVGIAFAALDSYPALAQARSRLLSATAAGSVATVEVVGAIESDIALSIAVLRLANDREHGRGHIQSVVDAVELLRPRTLRALASRVHAFDFFERTGPWDAAPERFRLHAQSTQRAAAGIAAAVGYADRDRLAVTSLLHDIGKLVMIHAYPGYSTLVCRDATPPAERALRERSEIGVDHAAVGGVVIRRWGLPVSLASAIEEHHNPDADGEAAIIRLADMLATHERGARVSPRELLHSARSIGLGQQELRRLMYELPIAGAQRQLPGDACPLSERELRVLTRLAGGSVYKEIARDLDLSASTVRSHLHNIYGKLDVANGAQAVLLATSRGWL